MILSMIYLILNPIVSVIPGLILARPRRPVLVEQVISVLTLSRRLKQPKKHRVDHHHRDHDYMNSAIEKNYLPVDLRFTFLLPTLPIQSTNKSNIQCQSLSFICLQVCL